MEVRKAGCAFPTRPPPLFPCLHGPQVEMGYRAVREKCVLSVLAALAGSLYKVLRGQARQAIEQTGKVSPVKKPKTTYLLSDLPNCPRPQECQRNLWGCRAGGGHRDLRQ